VYKYSTRVHGYGSNGRVQVYYRGAVAHTTEVQVYYGVQVYSSCTGVQVYRSSTGIHGVHEM